jgi:DNA-3-methyladenine glycosylase
MRSRWRSMSVAEQPSGVEFWREPLLTRDFFARNTVEVACDLIGCRIERLINGKTVVATILEVEAYLGENDPASHAFRGPTSRSSVMFGPAGHLYVYLSYGMHRCVNVVTENDGVAGAVLLRGAEVASGVDVVRTLRGNDAAETDLLRGPGNLGKGLAMQLSDTGLDVCSIDSAFRFVPGDGGEMAIAKGPRVGISKAVDAPLRFWKEGK